MVAWGAWYFIWGNDGDTSNPASVNDAYNFGSDASVDGEVQGDVDVSDFEVKG